MAELRELSEAGSLPPVLLFSLASVEATQDFYAERWPDARVVADKEKELYGAFGRRRGSLRKLFGLGVWKRGFQLWRRGYGVGKAVGDPLVMSGFFAVDWSPGSQEATITAAHDPKNAGDHPDWVAFADRKSAVPPH